MKNFVARFSVPLDVPRARGARLIEAFSLKLDRRVRFFDHRTFEHWVMLEADPCVLSFCERPMRIGPKGDDLVIDFWVGRSSSEELVVVQTAPPMDWPQEVRGLPVRLVPPAELSA